MEALVKCLFPAASLPASKKTMSEITEAVDELPSDNQQPLRLQYLEGMTRKQVAESLGWTLSKVHRKITRGITLVRKQINPIDNITAELFFQQLLDYKPSASIEKFFLLILPNPDLPLTDATIQKVYRAMVSLPYDKYQALVWHYFQQTPEDEMPYYLEWSSVKIHNEISRGLALLKLKLNPGRPN
jgi:DNA-directed RNA polymerase specialized sigma24 family protein